MEKNYKPYYYLAYGSNMSLRQMAVRCKDAVPVGVSSIPNYRLAFKGSKTGYYLTIQRSNNYYSVPVVVWKVTARDIENLDIYEGYPNFYNIKRFDDIVILTPNGEFVRGNGFAYIMEGEREYGIPTPNYFGVCAEGYQRFDLPIHYLDDALEFTRSKM